MSDTTVLSIRIDRELAQKLDFLASHTQHKKSVHAAEGLRRYIEDEAWQVEGILQAMKSLDEKGGQPIEDVDSRMRAKLQKMIDKKQ